MGNIIFDLALIIAVGAAFLTLGRLMSGKSGQRRYDSKRLCPIHTQQYRTSCPCNRNPR